MTTPLPAGYGPDSRLKEGPEPKYMQLAAVLAARIERGDFPEDARLPSVAQLQNEFGVSRGTAQRAVSVLAEHGRVRVSNGKGAWPVHEG
ncbi:GntR family transcriptional regulator [Nocardiopsis alba]|uniref:GntR family transcriptional regulator n=1 Tax=Nocardiopsis alba TaxID=53437 RepID=UPI0033C42264